MIQLYDEVIRFFHRQPYTVVTTIDKDGYPHNSCKGIAGIDKDGIVYLLDVYKAETYSNLQTNPSISITAVDEHKFIGYSLKGKAELVKRDDIKIHIMNSWEERILKRISSRVVKNIKGEKGHSYHPESLLPKPAYLIVVKVEKIVDLTPKHIKIAGN